MISHSTIMVCVWTTWKRYLKSGSPVQVVFYKKLLLKALLTARGTSLGKSKVFKFFTEFRHKSQQKCSILGVFSEEMPDLRLHGNHIGHEYLWKMKVISAHLAKSHAKLVQEQFGTMGPLLVQANQTKKTHLPKRQQMPLSFTKQTFDDFLKVLERCLY
jgi:hypothetical protein